MKQLRITLRRSTIGFHKRQKETARSLGLTKINKTVVHPDTPAIRGMVNAIDHLIEVEELDGNAD